MFNEGKKPSSTQSDSVNEPPRAKALNLSEAQLMKIALQI